MWISKSPAFGNPSLPVPSNQQNKKSMALGYSLLVFVYDKKDDRKNRTATLNINHVIFVQAKQTGDYQTTSGILKLLDNNGNLDDIVSFMTERFLPVDKIQALELAKEVLQNRPCIGYLTISNALQWRLQYSRVIEQAGVVNGVERLV
ncbi:MAG: hypothetical protein ABSA77_07910 [Thermoguttaceae bacterium]